MVKIFVTKEEYFHKFIQILHSHLKIPINDFREFIIYKDIIIASLALLCVQSNIQMKYE